MDVAVDAEHLDICTAEWEKLDPSRSEKRPVEGEDSGDLIESPPRKKARGDFDTVGCMRRVAEIVLVLSGMSKLRGSRKPTATEVEMMTEARTKVAELCGELAPQDIIPRNAIESVVDDLGLCKVKDEGSGLHPPKMSISEKMLLTKKKMEQSKIFNVHSVTCKPQPPHPNVGLVSENNSASWNGHVLSSERKNLLSISSNKLPAAVFTPVSQNLSFDGVKSSTVSSGLPANHLARTPLQSNKTEQLHFVLEGRLPSSSTSHIVGNPSNIHSVIKSSMLSKSTSSLKGTPENKSLNQNSESTEFTSGKGTMLEVQTGRDQPSRTHSVQTSSGNLPHKPLQGIYPQIPSTFNSHVEISRFVQNFLQSRSGEQCAWTPPSREYTNKALTCQICKITVNEVESVLVCDACENGFHLKCIQFKGVHVAEWHCPRCLALSNGKPLPPKYGRVMRSIGQPKVSQRDGAQCSERRMSSLGQKGSQNKMNSSEESGDNVPSISACMDNVCAELASEISRSNGQLTSSEATQALPKGKSSELYQPCPFGERPALCILNEPVSYGGFGSVINSQNPSNVANTVSENTANIPQDGNGNEERAYDDNNRNESNKQQSDDLTGKYVDCASKSERLDCKSAHDPSQVGYAENDVKTGSSQNTALTTDVLRQVEWVSDAVKVVDGKSFYEHCCIEGIVYKVHDHVLLRSTSNKLIPSKIQAMWEDGKTKLKWISVNRCFFPADLPPAVGHPCGPESNEVYESNHSSAVIARLIQGPCEVLPSKKFEEELERRIRTNSVSVNKLGPLFLCKWSYDQARRLFRPIMG